MSLVNDMICNQAGRELIEQFEGCRLEAYQDGNGVQTIGYGHTRGVKSGDTCTQEEANLWLEQDLNNVESGITRTVKKQLSENQFSALCSLVYNIGLGHWAASSALQLINASMFAQVPIAIAKWCKINGEVSKGLLARRTAEVRLWNQP